MDPEALLRREFDALAALLDDPRVEEVVVTAPDKVLVKREGVVRAETQSMSTTVFAEATQRLLEVLGHAPTDTPRVLRHRMDAGRCLIVVPRRSAHPLIRIEMRPQLRTLSQWSALGAIDAAVEGSLHHHGDGCVLIYGPHGSPRESIAQAIVGLQPEGRRIVQLISDGAARLHPRALQEVEHPTEALALGADVMFAPELEPSAAAGLLASGRPFVASIEASSEIDARRRLLSLLLLGDAAVSRAAAEALLQSSSLLGVRVHQTTSSPGASSADLDAFSEPARFDDATPIAVAANEPKGPTLDLEPLEDAVELTDARVLPDRGATVTGPPLEDEVPSQVRVAWAARETGSEIPLQPNSLLTHSAITPARDPGSGRRRPPGDDVDQTHAAPLEEMLAGSDDLEIQPSSTQAHPWDVESEDESPFEDEKTPVASLFTGKRRRVRAEGPPDES